MCLLYITEIKSVINQTPGSGQYSLYGWQTCLTMSYGTETGQHTDVGSKFDQTVAGERSCKAGHLKHVVYLRFKKPSEISDFHFEISDLIFS